jgi:hypothetical protein
MKEVTTTSSFKAWFGASQVVDRYGKPLIVYHGTPDVRGLLESGFRRSQHRGSTYFATDDYKTASSYADPHRAWDYQGSEPAVVPLYLSIKNPMRIDANFKHWRGTEPVVNEARDAGHDGVIIENVIDHYNILRKQAAKRKDASTVYVFFSPTQAKSPLNDGSFSAEDPSLLRRLLK